MEASLPLSHNGVYQQLNNILSTIATPQAKSFLQCQAKASMLTLDHSKARGQRVAQEAVEAGVASSPA
jgi:hypothetical protein